jgi:ABC-type cobalamin/Fe3+-siderophores transport system ATPase subunit
MVAIVGPNGAGKTTLLRVANGTIRPEHGSVVLFGDDLIERRDTTPYVKKSP